MEDYDFYLQYRLGKANALSKTASLSGFRGFEKINGC